MGFQVILAYESIVICMCSGKYIDIYFLNENNIFATYKPDHLDRTTHLRPPLSRRLSTSIFVQLYPSIERTRVTVPAHPLAALIGSVQFERLFERTISKQVQPMVTAILRDEVCISQKEDV